MHMINSYGLINYTDLKNTPFVLIKVIYVRYFKMHVCLVKLKQEASSDFDTLQSHVNYILIKFYLS